MFVSHAMVISIILQVEFTESLTMTSGLFAVIVLSVLTGMSRPHDGDVFVFIVHRSFLACTRTICL